LGSSLALSCKDNKPEETVDAARAAVSAAPAVSSAAADASADAGAATDGRPRGERRGPNAVFFEAARALDLKPEQKGKIEAAERSLRHGGGEAKGDAGDPKDAKDAMKEASKELHAELLAAVKAGKIDAAKLEPRYAALERAMSAEHDKQAAALTALHDALDATQRKTVIVSVRAKILDREEKMAAHAKGHAGDAGDAGADAGKPHAGKRAVDHLLRGLELDADQQKRVDALTPKDEGKGMRPDMAELNKHMEALLVAFEKDAFDAKKVDAFDAKRFRGPMEEETKLLGQLLPILKPEQREKLAAKMEKGPSPHGRHGGGGGDRVPALDEEEHEGDPVER
jgi:Spy/CpxP family protein refolding chaperone